MAAAVWAGGNLVHNFSQALGVSGNAQRMSRRGGVALLDRGHSGFHKTFEQRLNIVVKLAVFVGHRSLRSERQSQPYGTFVERLHVLRHVRFIAQTRRRIAFRIDQL